ncbi:MAG: glycosyltransferase family 9 protein, partial [Bacteroidota bacterium]
AEKIWNDAGLAGFKVIGLNPGGVSVPEKLWTPQGFAELADLLQNRGFIAAFFGGTYEIGTVNKIRSLMKTEQIRFTGRLNLLQLAALIKKCVCFVSAETGPMHLAISQEVPVVLLHGPTSQHCTPYTDKKMIVRSGLPCLGCKTGHSVHTCMKTITAKAVYEAVKQFCGE